MIDRDIELTLADGACTLRPTVKALKLINREYGSVLEAMRRVKQLDFDAICGVIAAGAEVPNGRGREHLEESVFQTGLIKTVGPVGDYLAVFMEGPDGDEAGDDSPMGKP